MQIDEIWERNYVILGDYISQHDRLPSPSENIYNWILGQRYLYKRGILSEEKIEKLELLFHWIWDTKATKWEEIYQEVLKYIQIHGCLPNKNSDPRLSGWLSRQKNIDKWKKDLLEKLPKYSDLERDILWEKKYYSLKRHSRDLEIVEGSISSLSIWICEQKELYQNEILPQDKIDLLEKIPKWSWEKKEMYSTITKIKEYVENNGKLPSSSGDKKSSVLRKWIEKQKTRYDEGLLSSDEIKNLESIKGWMWRNKKRKNPHTETEISKKPKIE